MFTVHLGLLTEKMAVAISLMCGWRQEDETLECSQSVILVVTCMLCFSNNIAFSIYVSFLYAGTLGQLPTLEICRKITFALHLGKLIGSTTTVTELPNYNSL